VTLTLANTGIATSFNWTIEEGELVRLRIPVLDADSNPFTVTSWTVDAKIKDRPGGEVLHTWSVGDIEVTGTNVTLTVLPATSIAWTFHRGWYRVKVIHPSDSTQIYRILQGHFRISPD
jgi:hypothetical protein